MDVRPTGPDPAGARFDPAATRVSPAAKIDNAKPVLPGTPLTDSISPLIEELAPPDIERLIRLLEPLPPAASAPLLSAVLQAASNHDLAAVLSAVGELVLLDPNLAETLPSRPELDGMRPEIDQLLNRSSSLARLSAEEKLGHAAQWIETGAVKNLTDWNTPPGTLLRVGYSLVDAGGLANYSKAADVAQVIVDALRFFPLPERASIAEHRPRSPDKTLNMLLHRTPWVVVLASLAALALLRAVLLFSR